MSTAQQTGAVATRANWVLVEATWDIFEPLLARKPDVAAEMAAEIYAIAQRYAAQHMQKRAGATAPDAR